MSDSIATYSFLSWLRIGIANKIGETVSAKARATVPVNLLITGQAISGTNKEHPITRPIQLYGPGDIIGIDQRSIVKNEPRNWITNFESNYMPYIEFYDEDFPWRYSPSAVNTVTDRLMPWLALVVLKDGEFVAGKNMHNRPLSYIQVTNASEVFQPFDQLWAWAHVHINESVIDSNIVASSNDDLEKVVKKFEAVLKENPDLAYSRIMCPRKLEPNTSYTAFLIPVYESGRLAGLGLDPDNTPNAEFSSWKSYNSGEKEDEQLFPVYHQWFFQTGSLGDFEYLARLLKPQPIDNRVGVRDMDVQQPGVNVSGIDDVDLQGILKLGGALKIPFETLGTHDKEVFTKYDEWDQAAYPRQFQKDLASFINLADDYEYKDSEQANLDANIGLTSEDDKDPIITAPLYGQWHALVTRLLDNRDGSDLANNSNWVHQLNLDPRYRTSAGFGTGVIQKNQEDYMEAAWKQVGSILEANQKIRIAQLAKATSSIWYNKHLKTMLEINPEKAFLFMAPMHTRVVADKLTVNYTIKESKVPAILTSPEMRRVMRPGSRLMKQLPFDNEITITNIIDRINKGEVLPAPPKKAPETIPTLQDIADEYSPPEKLPKFLADLVIKYPWIKWLFLFLFILFLFLSTLGSFLSILFIAIALVSAYLYYLINKYGNEAILDDNLNEENIKPELVDSFPNSSDFTLNEVDNETMPTFGQNDNQEATNFKEALRDNFDLIDVSRTVGEDKKKPALDLSFLVKTTFEKINPEVTIPHLIYSLILIPPRIRFQMPEEFVEAMVYPEFDIPMYKPLKDISSELFLPNINFIANNSISLLETNQKFIEAYMVGLNHEFARELLWREYPTDQRGSYFRQFWDTTSYLPELKDKSLTIEKQKDKLRDIPPVHLWPKKSKLGDHDYREQAGDKGEEVVLAIRGELLKKYPSAVIYAHKARWHQETDGQFNFKKERELMELKTEEELKDPPKNIIKTPLYEAKVDPDITFFGFDLSVKEAIGKNGDNPAIDKDFAGWFFVIKERPGEPRFGLDIGPATNNAIDVWNDLSWDRVSPHGNFLVINTIPNLNIGVLNGNNDNEKVNQNVEDKNINWNADMKAADLAYILYQVPVMIAIHASEMLPKQ